jgi:hypothetical protein
LKFFAYPSVTAQLDQALRTSTEQVMSVKHLKQEDLAGRWGISPRTLERWRWLGQGPRYIKIGGRVVYRLEDVERFELDNIQEAGRETQP